MSITIALGIYSDFFNKTTGYAVSNHNIGPSLQEQECVKSCASMGCDGDMECMKRNSQACLTKCNVQKPPVTEETACMESCVIIGCKETDFSCQGLNKEKCEKQCNMVKEPEAKSEEEKCIRDCVNNIQPGLTCQGGEGGEKGNEICRKCSLECVHLYAGPCLTEEKLEEKKKECQTCEHCYGAPIMGDSGEGYECIINIECRDASSEFGDNSKGIISKAGETVGNILESIGDFFSGIFSDEKQESDG